MSVRSMIIMLGSLAFSMHAAADVSASNFRLEGPDSGKVTLSWIVSGSVGGFGGLFYQNGTYNVAVSRGTDANQLAQDRTLVEGPSYGTYMQQTGNSGSVVDTPPEKGKTYYYWLHYSAFSIIDDTKNFFFLYQGKSFSGILAASCIGPISVFVPGEPVDVRFDPNGGEGSMEDQEFTPGVKQTLRKNEFTRRGFVFQGWSSSPGGSVEYGDESEFETEENATLYAVWTVPALRLVPKSADWGAGSLDLLCIDEDQSGAEHRYTLSFFDYDSETWTNVDGAVDAAGTTLSDKSFTSRVGGVREVLYRVSDEVGRVSDPCATRTRHGLVVGLSTYSPQMQAMRERNGIERITELEAFRNDATLLRNILTSAEGGVDSSNMRFLLDSNAKVSDISREWKSLSDSTRPGDVVFFSISTHGAANGVVMAYDGGYSRAAFQRDLEPFRSGDGANVKVVVMMNNCHSETMTSEVGDIEYEYGSVCTANIIYFSVADSMEFGWSFGNHFQFGDYFLGKGLAMRQADAQRSLANIGSSFGNADRSVDLLECARYLGALANGISDRAPTHAQYDTAKLRIMADTVLVSYEDATSPVAAPAAPSECVADVASSRGVWVCWNNVEGADYYKVYYAKSGESTTEHWKYVNGFATYDQTFWEFTFGKSWDNGFLFRTADAATSEDRLRYYPLDNDTEYQFRVVAVNAGGMSASCSPVTVRTDVASRAPSYKIVFNATGGTPAYSERYVDGGSPLGTLPTPTNGSRVFAGWYTQRKGGDNVTDSTVATDDMVCYAHWESSTSIPALPAEWLLCYPSTAAVVGSDADDVSSLMSANGTRTVGECYALGINPEDPDDDLKITYFTIQDGKPVVTVNHTVDGSGNSFESRIKTLGKAHLSDKWEEVPDTGNPEHRFFTIRVEGK